MNSYKKFKLQNGVALLITILIMFLILSLGVYVLNFSSTETKIATSQITGSKTYYLAEAGIQEMVWKLKNDATYKNSFETNPTWTTNFTRTDPFGPGSGSYTVSMVNTSESHGDITSTGSVNINGKTSQRIIKTTVYRLIGLSGMGTNAIISGSGTTMLNSELLNITGDLYSNGDIIMQGSHPGVGVVDGNITTAQSIEEGNGDLTVSGTTSDENSVPAPAPIVLPGVDFTSLYNQADTKLSGDAALDALSSANGITWVNTAADIERDMVINGLLVVNGNLIITNSADITINHTAGSPSGIIVNGNLIIEKMPNYNGDIIISGILYVTGSITLNKLNSGYIFNVTGGITSGNGILMKNCSRTLEVIYNNEILTDSLTPSSNSPTIVIDHWEEEY